jgi:hypothetical protein
LAVVQRLALAVMGGPKDLGSWGRSFVSEGTLVEVRPDLAALQKKTFTFEWKYMLFGDVLLLGKQDGRRYRVKHAYPLDTASVIDVEDSRNLGGGVIARDVWALQLATAVFFRSTNTAEKMATIALFSRVTKACYDQLVREKESQETIRFGLSQH